MDEVEGLDEEFLFHLNRGSDLLARGDAIGARGALERALELRARDPKVLGLLGQACYRLGKYEDAIVAWQRLVDESPAEPSARVNLGLAFLKARRQGQAIRQLEIALDLNPDHKKAMGYLGLALLESGDPLRAREWFVRAGSDQLVARCDALLQGAAAGQDQAAAEAGAGQGGGLEVDDAGAAPEPEPELAHAAPPPEAEPAAASSPAGGTPGQPPASAAAPVAAPASEGAPAAGQEHERERAEPLAEMAAFAAARGIAVPPGTPFGVRLGVAAVRVSSPVRARLAGLLALRGTVEATPEVKRFRGRPTDKPFGLGAARFHHLQGEGTLLFSFPARRFTALQLADAAFVREEALFAMDDALAFENGRVPSTGGEELDLVHIRGHGAVLLLTAGAPRALEVQPGAPLRLPLEALVAWIGALTPRLVPLVEGGPAELVGVELAGEGTVLVDPGGREAGEAT